MKTIINEKHISFDNKEFNSKELCELYENNFLTDEKLINCFHFFHKKHENDGDLDTAKKPSDARHYKFMIERNSEKQIIKLYEYFRTYPTSKLCSRYTSLGFILKHNKDFLVLYDAIDGRNDRHYYGERTYRIKEFYAFLDKINTTIN